MKTTEVYFPNLEDVHLAAATIKKVASQTPLNPNLRLSEQYGANILMKREDLQLVRSYKIRGAYNKMASLSASRLSKGVVCASAGNHAQGVALSCRLLKVHGTIFMPSPTPRQKIEQVKMFGKAYVDVQLVGDSFDDAHHQAKAHCQSNGASFIHPFDDEKVIEGQATMGLEILEQADEPIDYLLVPIGGGGLSAGIGSLFKTLSPHTKIIGVEPLGAPSMQVSLENGENTALETIERFVDGAAVKRVGDLNFHICQQVLDKIVTVDEGKVCETILELYNRDAIVVEPAGALTLAALAGLSEEIYEKNVVCIVSGGNNDITRTEEIKERALLYQGLKHYFIVNFPQRTGALKEFVSQILGPTDDISHFEYTKKNSRETGSAVVGIELKRKDDLENLVERMKAHNFFGQYLNNQPDLLQILI
ncbi:MAG: threonine ammonia-lyase [Cyclobacteriaceae bacterium]